MAELNLHPTAFPKIEAACPELDEEQIATLAQFAASRQFKAGETLLAAGEQELKLFVVKSGEVEVREHSFGRSRDGARSQTIHGRGRFARRQAVCCQCHRKNRLRYV